MERALEAGAVLLAIVLVPLGCGSEVSVDPAGERRIVTLDGAITEIVFALGEGAHVVGVDTSSTYPPEVAELPTVGSHHRISPEAVLALRPTHVLSSARAPATALAQLGAAGIVVTRVEPVEAGGAIGDRIRAVGAALGRGAAAEELAARVGADLERVRARVASAEVERPRVMFIYARGANVLQVAGTKTPAAEMIELAGGVNAVTAFEGYRPLGAEAVVTAQPDVLLMMTSGAASLQGEAGVFGLPGVALTPAGRHRRLIQMDGLLLLGFAARTAEAVGELHAELARVRTAARAQP